MAELIGATSVSKDFRNLLLTFSTVWHGGRKTESRCDAPRLTRLSRRGLRTTSF
jgi:hypothetical protein